MNIGKLMSEMLNEPFVTAAQLREDTKGDFCIYTTANSYVVVHEEVLYVFGMKEPMNPEKNRGAQLAFVFLATDEQLAIDASSFEAKKGFKVFPDDKLGHLQEVEGPAVSWLRIPKEHWDEVVTDTLESIKEQKANRDSDSPTIH